MFGVSTCYQTDTIYNRADNGNAVILVILRRKSGNSNPVFIGADISTSQYERSRTTTEEAISVWNLSYFES